MSAKGEKKMEVTISVMIREGPYSPYDERWHNEAAITAEPNSLQAISWPLLCAGLVEKVLREAITALTEAEAATVAEVEAEESE